MWPPNGQIVSVVEHSPFKKYVLNPLETPDIKDPGKMNEWLDNLEEHWINNPPDHIKYKILR